MVIGLYGAPLPVLQAAADSIKLSLLAGVHAGDSYRLLSADPKEAEALFRGLLQRHAGGEAHIFYLAEEPRQLSLLPADALLVSFDEKTPCALRLPPDCPAEEAGQAILALLARHGC